MDQNFGRSHRADARIAPCIIPKGKYVVTGAEKWRLLGEVLAEIFLFFGESFLGKNGVTKQFGWMMWLVHHLR